MRTVQHNSLDHGVFSKFNAWEGECRAGFNANYIGAQTRNRYCNVPPWNRAWLARYHVSRTPPRDEDYFCWVDVLQSVLSAKREFVMIDLGAGYGNWLCNAALATRQRPDLSYRLVAVEAEPTHFKWIRQHFADNRIRLDRCELVRAAIAPSDGYVWFRVGRPSRWYGQSIVNVPRECKSWHRLVRGLGMPILGDGTRTKRVPSLTLGELLAPWREVDLVLCDIQGSELAVMQTAGRTLAEKVRRVHVRTHGERLEVGMRSFFWNLGWRCLFDFTAGRAQNTPFGTVCFGDGLQSWINPAFP